MNILIFFLLLVTIPRYSAAFGDIDNWTVFGFAVTAIGEAIAMGLGEYTITRTLLRCNQAQARHRSDYESRKARNDETGRGTRKLDHIPELVGSGRVLGVFLILLEALADPALRCCAARDGCLRALGRLAVGIRRHLDRATRCSTGCVVVRRSLQGDARRKSGRHRGARRIAEPCRWKD